MFIPVKYRRIIPKEPLYTELGEYIIPGSHEWFTYILLEETNQRIKDAEEGAILHGTSAKRYHHHANTKNWLTLQLNSHYEEMTDLTKNITNQAKLNIKNNSAVKW
ncbi:hypothetical protein GLOIN_2v1788892 [Rhizophagus irregularis DAOM 181602=DAOM 197198]|nr:hypothetical protein GLOIN_2v1788892 [Rhizophagus irregularis DAOM 181602=DAOM 197198]CAG8533784.1 18513_t:CDS:2 [Rhizophagus irregularis]